MAPRYKKYENRHPDLISLRLFPIKSTKLIMFSFNDEQTGKQKDFKPRNFLNLQPINRSKNNLALSLHQYRKKPDAGEGEFLLCIKLQFKQLAKLPIFFIKFFIPFHINRRGKIFPFNSTPHMFLSFGNIWIDTRSNSSCHC